jgi:hypothetical protein
MVDGHPVRQKRMKSANITTMTVIKAVLAIHKENLSSDDIIDANPSLDCINLGNNTSNIC